VCNVCVWYFVIVCVFSVFVFYVCLTVFGFCVCCVCAIGICVSV